MVDKKKSRVAGIGTASKTTFDSRNSTPPIVTGPYAEVYGLIRQHQSVLSLLLTADHALPEAAARVHNSRAMGLNMRTTILPEAEFRGVIRRNTALYSLGSPEWLHPGFFDEEEEGK